MGDRPMSLLQIPQSRRPRMLDSQSMILYSLGNLDPLHSIANRQTDADHEPQEYLVVSEQLADTESGRCNAMFLRKR